MMAMSGKARRLYEQRRRGGLKRDLWRHHDDDHGGDDQPVTTEAVDRGPASSIDNTEEGG